MTLPDRGGQPLHGFYYVRSATHRLGPNGYQTTFSVRRTTALAADGSASAPDAGADQGVADVASVEDILGQASPLPVPAEAPTVGSR